MNSSIKNSSTHYYEYNIGSSSRTITEFNDARYVDGPLIESELEVDLEGDTLLISLMRQLQLVLVVHPSIPN